MKDYRRYVGGVVNGLLVVAIGVILLLHNLGYISWDLWTAVLKLWPLLLILGGLNIIFFGRSYIGLGVFIILAVLVIGGLSIGFGRDSDGHFFFGYNGGTFGGPRFTEVIEKSQPLPAGSTRGTVTVEMSAGRLQAGGASAALVEASLDQRNWPDSMRPEFTADGDQVTIRQSSLHGFSLGGLTNQTWTLKLTDQVPLDLTLDVGAGDINLDLSAYKLESLRYNAGAASSTIVLGDKSPQTSVILKAGAASTTVEVPKAAGVRVTATTGIGSTNLGSLGYSKEGRTYTSPNYDTAASKIDIEFTGGVGSFNLEPR